MRFGKARISDDTQMTLFTVAGLLSALQEKNAGGGVMRVAPIGLFYNRYSEKMELAFSVFPQLIPILSNQQVLAATPFYMALTVVK